GGRRRPGRAQRVRLRLPASLGDCLGEVREEHREPEPERDHPDEPERARVPADDVEHEDPGRYDAAELDDEHHGVANLMPWVEFRERVADGSDDDLAREGARGGARHQLVPWASRARLSSSTLTPGSPKKSQERPIVYF